MNIDATKFESSIEKVKLKKFMIPAKTYSLFLNKRKFKIPRSYELLIKISEHLFDHKEYYVLSNVKDETFQHFINFLLNDEFPLFHADDILEYIDLFKEFEIRIEILKTEEEINLYQKAIINDLTLEKTNAKRKVASEKYISNNLDEFLDKHSNEMSKININSLYNIFNHKERKLTNHDLAYRFITENNGQFLILLQSIDGSKLSFNFYRDAIDKQNEHYDFIPINITSHIDDCNKEHQKMKEIINELQEKFEEDKRKSSTMHKKELNMLKEQQQKQLEELEEMHKRETEEIRNEIKMMKEEQQQKFEEAEERHKKEIDEMKDEIIIFKEKLATIEEKYKKEINDAIEEQKRSNPLLSFTNVIIKNDLKSKGIFEELRNEQINPYMKYDPPFIVSQSSNDIYNILNPETQDEFQYVIFKEQNKKTYLQIELKEKIELNGIEFNAEGIDNPLKSFSIEFDNQKSEFNEIEIKEFDDKDSKKRVKRFNFNTIECKKIKIIPNNKKYSNISNSEAYARVRKIELFSPKYPEGYFKSLINENQFHDPHKIGVHLSASRYDFNNFHLYGKDHCPNTTTYNIQNSWFQIELVKGSVILSGFRFKSPNNFKLLHYKIIASDDDKKEMWETLFEGNEEENSSDSEVSHQLTWLSRPVKFIRIIQTGKNKKNNELKFNYFDIFGIYFQ